MNNLIIKVFFFLILLVGGLYLLGGSTEVIENVVVIVPPEEIEEEVVVIEEIPVEQDLMEEITEEVLETVKMEIIDLIIPIMPIISSQTFNEINIKTREAVVNIFCTTQAGGLLQPITGSGVIVDPRGVILTNAHIAQYFLLKDYLIEDYINCTIRKGSPAVNAYKAEILFISSSWVKDNFQKITESNPKGTGENDYAFLLINDTTSSNTKLPNEFPFIPLDTKGINPLVGDTVVVAGYPAGFLGGTSIQKDLYILSTITDVNDVFTFRSNTLDLFSVGGNIVAQKGASGGAIVGSEGKLLGIVVTSTEAEKTEDRELRAISIFHINESLLSDSNFNIQSLLTGNLENSAFQFNQIVAPTLTDLYLTHLPN